MSIAQIKNEKIKRYYLRWLKEAQGYADPTIGGIEKSICLYEDFTNFADYAEFNSKIAIEFKEWLMGRRNNGESIGKSTQYQHLRKLKAFFGWLATEPGYKSKITIDAISYLSLDKKTVREITSPHPTRYPFLEYVCRLAGSIVVITEIDMRDRALIAFLLLSGMRDKAISSLPLGCFDPTTLRIEQLPRRGVDTKFGKPIYSTLLRFDEKLVAYIVDWARYLTSVRLFSSTDPLFPQTLISQIKGGLTFEAKEVKPAFWSNAGPIRRILQERSGAAGFEYFRPHSFRHAAIRLALKRCYTAEEIKAVSQNFGHENVSTTLLTYGGLENSRVSEIMDGLDFSSTPDKAEEGETIDKMMRMLSDLKNRPRK